MSFLSTKTVYFTAIYALTLFLFGCSSSVRHICSDVCLVKQGNTPKQVMDILGPPNMKTPTETGELWNYYTAQQSPLKRTPGVGMLFGTVTYDVIHITFTDNVVSNCQYRHANEQEFKQFKKDSKAKE
jgi:outer membrane protein assembly factor BamE (lipoprotein component of BamABCDE complex)